jgi:hypothetical protein
MHKICHKVSCKVPFSFMKLQRKFLLLSCFTRFFLKFHKCLIRINLQKVLPIFGCPSEGKQGKFIDVEEKYDLGANEEGFGTEGEAPAEAE